MKECNRNVIMIIYVPQTYHTVQLCNAQRTVANTRIDQIEQFPIKIRNALKATICINKYNVHVLFCIWFSKYIYRHFT